MPTFLSNISQTRNKETIFYQFLSKNYCICMRSGSLLRKEAEYVVMKEEIIINLRIEYWPTQIIIRKVFEFFFRDC